MKLTIDRAPLAKALETTRRIVAGKTTVPILANVLLAAKAGRLILRTTDLDLEAETSIEADVARDGELTVSAATLHDLTRKLPEKSQISLEAESDARLTLRSGRSCFHLQTLPASDWPDVPDQNYTHEFELEAKALAHMFAKTAFAISSEEPRYYLNGVFLHSEAGEDGPLLRMVATDGHRLSRVERICPQGADGMPAVIVPRKACAEAERLLKGADGAIRVSMSQNRIKLTLGAVTLRSKLIDGNYPDYKRVIPANNDKRARVDRETLAAAADRVSTISSERGRAVKLSFGEGELALSVINPDMGEAREEMEIDYSGPPLEIGFNSRYLAEILSAIEGDEVIVKLSDPGSPTLFQSKKSDDLLVVLMPMRV
jgi:DNA polymerase-3 subunit beta